MVSTRGVKLKFVDGERVLCYEPDPTKAKVLYDSKVLEVIINKDQRGRKTVEYLIHFQGWNSSWDRCVSEDYVLKDTVENRQLQRDLAAKAQLQLGAYLYRRDKKRTRKLSERINESINNQCSEEGSSGSPGPLDTDDTQPSSSESETSGEDEAVPIELTQNLRFWAELDNELITKKHKLVRLPAEPNVVSILEGYMRHYASCQMCRISDKPKTRYRHNQTNKTLNIDTIYRNLNICREFLDGLRIYFDFTLMDLLLYNQERQQALSASNFIKSESINIASMPIKTEPDVDIKMEDVEEFAHLPKLMHSDDSYIYDDQSRDSVGTGSRRSSSGANNNNTTPHNTRESLSIRRRLRSSRISQHSESASDGTAPANEINGFNYDSSGIKQECGGNMSNMGSTESDVSGPLAQVLAWKLIPDNNTHLPCFMYGAIHLLRLLVKLPELLWAANIPENKLKILLRHIDMFIDYLDEHREWFGEKHYVDALSVSIENNYKNYD